jgi:hypothetical protein
LESDDNTGQPPQKQRKKQTARHDDAELQDGTDTINISTDEDREFVDNFIQAVVDLAQESVGTHSKFSAHELLQIAGFRFPAKVFRPSFRKVNPFNLFLQDRKDSDTEELRKPAPGRPDVNMGRPAFTGEYQKQQAKEYKLRKSEYQQKAKEINDDPKAKLETDSDLKRYRTLMSKATDFGHELAKLDIHHIVIMVPQSASLPAKIIASNGYGDTYYKLLTHKGLNGNQFDAFCHGNELQAQLPKAAHAKTQRGMDFGSV